MKVSYGSIVVACLFVPLFPFVEREIERDSRYVRRGVGGVVGAWHDVPCVRACVCPASVGGGGRCNAPCCSLVPADGGVITRCSSLSVWTSSASFASLASRYAQHLALPTF
jgi:hypothetical protein